MALQQEDVPTKANSEIHNMFTKIQRNMKEHRVIAINPEISIQLEEDDRFLKGAEFEMLKIHWERRKKYNLKKNNSTMFKQLNQTEVREDSNIQETKKRSYSKNEDLFKKNNLNDIMEQSYFENLDTDTKKLPSIITEAERKRQIYFIKYKNLTKMAKNFQVEKKPEVTNLINTLKKYPNLAKHVGHSKSLQKDALAKSLGVLPFELDNFQLSSNRDLAKNMSLKKLHTRSARRLYKSQ